MRTLRLIGATVALTLLAVSGWMIHQHRTHAHTVLNITVVLFTAIIVETIAARAKDDDRPLGPLT